MQLKYSLLIEFRMQHLLLLLYGDFFVFYIRPTDRVRAHVFLIFARRQLPEEKENRRKNLEPGFYCHVCFARFPLPVAREG